MISSYNSLKIKESTNSLAAIFNCSFSLGFEVSLKFINIAEKYVINLETELEKTIPYASSFSFIKILLFFIA